MEISLHGPDIRKATRELEATYKRVVMQMLSVVQAKVISKTPTVTGNMMAGWDMRFYDDGIQYIGELFNPVPYTVYVIMGTGIYGPYGKPVVPVNKQALKFEIGGKTFIRKSVKGIKPNRIDIESLEEAQPLFDSIMKKELGSWLLRVGSRDKAIQMKALRSFLEDHFSALAETTGYDFLEHVEVDKGRDFDTGTTLMIRFMDDDYADVGEQTPVPVHADLLFVLMLSIGSGQSYKERSAQGEVWVKKIYRYLKANKTLGASWIKDITAKARFTYAEYEDINQRLFAYCSFQVGVEYEDDL